MNAELKAEVRRQALQIFWISLKAPFVMREAVKKIIWDKEATLDPVTGLYVVRGDLPPGYEDYADPVERPPGGIYEPKMLKILREDGPEACAYHWLGIRNRAHGAALRFSKPMTGHFTLLQGKERPSGTTERDGLWSTYKRLPFGFCFMSGYRSYHTKERGYYGTPVFGIKRA
jgi:hypothetical protein